MPIINYSYWTRCKLPSSVNVNPKIFLNLLVFMSLVVDFPTNGWIKLFCLSKCVDHWKYCESINEIFVLVSTVWLFHIRCDCTEKIIGGHIHFGGIRCNDSNGGKITENFIGRWKCAHTIFILNDLASWICVCV